MSVDIEKLEAVLESACKEAVRLGYTIGLPLVRTDGPICPLYAVCVINDSALTTYDGARALGLDIHDEMNFVAGFDQASASPSAHAATRLLGAKFRTRVDAGEFSRAVVCPEMT